jgi:signal transduction histidine kinase
MQAIACAQKQPSDEKLNQSLMQMLRLVSNMSDISRYSASCRMEIRDADAFLLELFEKAQTLTGNKVHLTFEGLKHPIFTLVDPEQLERAVWNILSNCMKFLPESGTIHASLTQRNRFLQLTIEDSGSGIAQQVQSTLFQRYLRQPGIEDPRYGLGLGMSIVRTAAANHGGTVLVSPAKNGGTRITMTIAIRPDDSTTLRSPVFRPDYTGGFDHGLVELSDCLSSGLYKEL